MKRVLYIGCGSPWAGGAGYLVRQQLFLRALREVSDLTLAMFDAKPDCPEPTGCTTIPLPMPHRQRPGRWGMLMADLLGRAPRMVRGYALEPPRQIVERLAPHSFDFVFCYRIDFGYFAGVLDHPRLLLDIDDPEHTRWRRRLQAMSVDGGDWRSRRDLTRLEQFEKTAVAHARLAFVCQPNDAKGWDITPAVVPNCVKRIENPVRDPLPGRVLFVGNCAGDPASPNVDAVQFFILDIWPLVLKAMPAAQFVIAGPAGETIKSLAAASSNITVLGFVENLSHEYARAALSIAPIRFGTGTRIKILEAFAHGCPMLSTLAGAEGIDAIPGRHFELASDAATFAVRCIDLLQNDALRETLGAGGYDLAGQKYDCEVHHRRLVSLLGEIIDPAGIALRAGK